MDGQPNNRNGLWLKVALAAIGFVLTVLTSIVGWAFSFLLETRNISNLNTTIAAANTVALTALILRVDSIDVERSRIAALASERGQTIPRIEGEVRELRERMIRLEQRR